MKIKGEWATKKVWIDGKLLSPVKSQKVYNHSPDGFNWSYGGSGPAQLALAILIEFFPNDALQYYQDLKRDFVAHMPERDFEMSFDIK